MSELRMPAKTASIILLYATFNDWMIEFVMSIRTTNAGVYVSTKKKSIVVVCCKAFLSLRTFCLFSVKTWWAAIYFLCLLVSWKITI